MKINLINDQGQVGSSIAVSKEVFARDYNESLIHQILIAYQANARGGNRAQKDRQQVSHSTKKPWRQKGTGNARAGMRSSPLWRGGGRIFPNSPEENFSQKINKKMYKAGMSSIFSQLVREDRLMVIENISIEAPKTKLLLEKLKGFQADSLLIVMAEISENLRLAVRNLPNILIIEPRHVNPVFLVRSKKVLIARDAVDQLQGLLS